MYSKKDVLKILFFIVALTTIMFLTNGVGFAIIILISFYALSKRDPINVMFCVLMCTVMLMTNSHLAIHSAPFAIMQRGLLMLLGFVSMVQMFGQRINSILRCFLIMYLYVAFMIIPSITGWNPKISFLKLFLFSLIYCSYVGVANNVALEQAKNASKKLRAIFLAICAWFIFGSVILIPFPGISQMQPEEALLNPEITSLFTGMCGHSQALGPLISSIAVFLLSDLFFSIKRFDKFYGMMLICCPYLIYLTSSRTGMGAFLLGIGFVVWVFMNAHGVEVRWKRHVMNWVFGVIVMLSISVLALPSVQKGIARFAVKWSDTTEVTVEEIVKSRQGKVDEMIENFKEKPLFGNGFQVSYSQQFITQDGLLLSAPMEKGVWYAAVLEEGGVVGFVIFTTFLFAAIFGSIKRRAYVTASCLFVNTLTNLGEFTFFSMSYIGGFLWSIVFLGVAVDAQRIKEERYFAGGYQFYDAFTYNTGI